MAELERENYVLKNTLNQFLSMNKGKYPTDPQLGFTEEGWLHELQQSVSTGTGTYHLNPTGHYCHSNELGFDSDSLPIPITPSLSITGSPSSGSWADAALIGKFESFLNGHQV